jgi:RND family efflux transporter MFP subunit
MWTICTLLGAGLTLGGGYLVAARNYSPSLAQAREGHGDSKRQEGVAVDVIKPQLGGMDRTTTQPGTVLAYESVPLFAAVSGYLKTLNVDIGSRVKEGQVLAEIDVPELVLELELNKAAVERSNAKVAQMRAHKKVAEADLEAAKASVKQAQAAAKSAKAWLRFREKMFHRMEDLLALKSIDERLLDESYERFEAATEALRAAEEAVIAAQSRQAANEAKVLQGDADIDETLAAVKVADAKAKKSQEFVNFATLKAPFDGIVSQRSVLVKHFIRAATLNSSQPPLLTVERTDLMRIVVMVPDRDIPFTDVGDEAHIEIDAVPGREFKAAISRIAGSEDPQTRLMRVEIDLPNPTGKICQGMYGRVTIILEKSANLLSVPSSCLVGPAENGKGKIFIVRGGKAILTSVTIGADNGLRVGILKGLKAGDQVILRPPSGLIDGTPVSVSKAK